MKGTSEMEVRETLMRLGEALRPWLQTVKASQAIESDADKRYEDFLRKSNGHIDLR